MMFQTSYYIRHEDIRVSSVNQERNMSWPYSDDQFNTADTNMDTHPVIQPLSDQSIDKKKTVKKRKTTDSWNTKCKKSKNPKVVKPPKARKPQFGDVDTLSEACVLQRVDRISVCNCGGYRCCDKCYEKYKPVFPQTYRHEDSDSEAEYDPNRRFASPPPRPAETLCKKIWDDDRNPYGCYFDGVGVMPCTLCLTFDSKPKEVTWTYDDDANVVLNEMGVCPGCMVTDPEDVCSVCHHDNTGWD